MSPLQIRQVCNCNDASDDCAPLLEANTNISSDQVIQINSQHEFYYLCSIRRMLSTYIVNEMRSMSRGFNSTTCLRANSSQEIILADFMCEIEDVHMVSLIVMPKLILLLTCSFTDCTYMTVVSIELV